MRDDHQAPRPPAGSPESAQARIYWFALGALTCLALAWRAAGLDPVSLWLDDEWVGIVVRRMSLSDFFVLRPPVPIGFVLVAKLIARLFSDPEWPLQILPLACGLAQVPLMAALCRAVTGRRALGLFAAALTVVAPLSTDLSVRVKPYTLDTLVTISLLLVGAPLLERWQHRRAERFAAGAAAALLFSFSSLFVSVALLHLALGLELLRREPGRRLDARALVTTLGFDLAVAIAYVTLLRGQNNAAMNDYWREEFLPLSLPGALRFLSDHGFIALSSALPAGLAPALLLAPLGLVELARRPERRGLAALFFALYALLLCASALKMYPAGVGRSDVFAHPALIVLITSGLGLVMSWRRIERASTIAQCALAFVLVVGTGRLSIYPESDDASVIRLAEDVVQPSDGLVILPMAALAVGYYANWPMRLVPWPDYAHGFHVVIERPHTVTLPPRAGFATRPSLFEPELQAFLATPYARIYYLDASFYNRAPRVLVDRRLRERGYTPEREVHTSTALLRLLVVKPK